LPIYAVRAIRDIDLNPRSAQALVQHEQIVVVVSTQTVQPSRSPLFWLQRMREADAR
jgi:hypothetical protein